MRMQNPAAIFNAHGSAFCQCYCACTSLSPLRFHIYKLTTSFVAHVSHFKLSLRSNQSLYCLLQHRRSALKTLYTKTHSCNDFSLDSISKKLLLRTWGLVEPTSSSPIRDIPPLNPISAISCELNVFYKWSYKVRVVSVSIEVSRKFTV